MYKVIEEFKLGFKNFYVLTIDRQMSDKRPYSELKKCRIDGVEYEFHFIHPCRVPPEKFLDIMLRNIAIQAPEGSSFVGKEIEFV